MLVDYNIDEYYKYESSPLYATALTGGLAAYFRSQNIGRKSPLHLYTAMQAIAKENAVSNVPAGCCNLLAYNGIFY